jgi:2,4-dienoyl-CoA reductase-like NADH-dependent reductase (Old Yellow Enzyme family)
MINNGKYPSVSSTQTLNHITLPNRIVFPPWHVNYANTDGTVSDKLMKFYTAFADGGCGLILTGAAAVSYDSIAFDRVMRIDHDGCVPGLKRLFSGISRRGSIPGIQLIHYGRQAASSVTGYELLAPSAIPCPVMSRFDPAYKVREMTLDDIRRVRSDFIDAAVRAAEIIEGIRDEISRIAISVRVSGDEFVDGGLTPPDFEEIIPLFEDAGMDMLNVSAGVYGSMERIVPPPSLGEMPHVGIAAELKRFATVPVCAVGSIFSIDQAESIISSGKSDLVAMGRAQVADPEIVKKSLAGHESDTRECTRCNECTFWTTGDPQMYCSVNPALKKRGGGRAKDEVYELYRAITEIDVFSPPRSYVEELLKVLCDTLGYRFGTVIEVDDHGKGWLIASHNAPEDYIEEVHRVKAPVLSSPSGEAIELCRIVVVHNPLSDPRLAPWYEITRLHNLETIVWMPLLGRGRVFGTYVFYDTRIRDTSEEELQLLEKVRVMISIALNSNQHLDQLSQKTSEPGNILAGIL